MKTILLFIVILISTLPTASFCEDNGTIDLLTLVDPPAWNSSMNKGSGKIYLYDSVTGNGKFTKTVSNLNDASKKALANVLTLAGYNIVDLKAESDVQIYVVNVNFDIDSNNPGLPKLKEDDGKIYKFASIDNYKALIGFRKTKLSDEKCNDVLECIRIIKDFSGIMWNQNNENYTELGMPGASNSTKVASLFSGYKKFLLAHTQNKDFKKLFD